MRCPKCDVVLMSDERTERDHFIVRCIKCGSEYIIDHGRMEQKKIRRTITVTKHEGRPVRDTTLSGPSLPHVEQERLRRLHADQQRVLRDAERVRAMNDLMRHHR